MLNYAEIGAKITYYRKKKQLSQEQLAEKIWISTTHMSHIETGSTKLSLPVLVDIAKVLNISVDELLSLNLKKQEKVCIAEIDDILQNCSSNQIKILTDVIKSTKKALDENN